MTSEKNIYALVLAAGLGTRMKSTRAKVLHEVLFKPMLIHVLDTIKALTPQHTYVIVGYQREKVAKLTSSYAVSCLTQKEQLGTGHAVLCAEKELGTTGGTVLILSGDVPLIKADSLKAMLAIHAKNKAALTLMTTTLDEPTNYGRIIRDHRGRLLEIVEEKDATEEQRNIREINAGIYCAEASFLFKALNNVGCNNKQGEVYLTDIVKVAIDAGLRVGIFSGAGGGELLGINSRNELAAANKYLQHQKNEQLLDEGVNLLDPETIFIQQEVAIGRGTEILANVQISGNSRVGRNCTIGPDVVLHDCLVGDHSVVGPFSRLSSCIVENNETVAPHTNLGPPNKPE